MPELGEGEFGIDMFTIQSRSSLPLVSLGYCPVQDNSPMNSRDPGGWLALVRLCCETSVGLVYQRQTDSSLSRSRNACHPLPRDLVGVPNPLNRVNDLLLHLRGFLNHVVELFCALGETVQPSHVV